MRIIYQTKEIQVVEIEDADGDTQRLLCIGPSFAPPQGGFKTAKPRFHIHQFSRNLTYGALCAPGGIHAVLFLGFGAGITIQAIRDLFPVAAIDIVDINPGLFDVSRAFFFNLDAANIRIVTSDAYRFIQQSTMHYDYICCDIWTGGLEIPDYLRSGEFYASAKRILTPRGVFAINTQASEHKQICHMLVKHFRYVASFEANNSTFLALDDELAIIDDPKLISQLLSTNLDAARIHDDLVIMHGRSCQEC